MKNDAVQDAFAFAQGKSIRLKSDRISRCVKMTAKEDGVFNVNIRKGPVLAG